jgi:hypothetical protein
MTDEVIDWPTDLLPSSSPGLRYAPHVGGAESPLTRTRKVYGLTAPRWTTKLGFVASRRGGQGVGAAGARIDALLSRIEGGLVLVRLWDFWRPYPVGLQRYHRALAGAELPFTTGETFSGGEAFVIGASGEALSEAAEAGATTIVFAGFETGAAPFDVGDYFQLLARPRIIQSASLADDTGRVAVTFAPPIEADVFEGEATVVRASGVFQLANPDAAAGDGTRGQRPSYALEFVEFLP